MIGSAALLASVVLAASSASGDEAPPAGGGQLRISAEPPRLLLGRDDEVELRVAAPLDVEELSLTANAGRVEGLRRLPSGGFVARYRPPAEHVPQVAIVSALGRGARGLEDGWLAIPMSGRGTARVRGAPGTPVTLRIGDRTFGPQTAGADGVAAIPVVVPPGIHEGHQGFRPIDLHIPEKPLLHAVADRAGVHADREEKVRVVAYVVAPHGAARRGDAPVFEPSRGSVISGEREAGAYHASWTLPPGPAGEERLTVRLPSAPGSRTVLRVDAAAGAPALVAVSFDRPELVAGGDAASVVARSLDAAGNPVPATLSLAVSGGVVSNVVERRPGEVVARVSAGSLLQGDEAVVTATAAAQGISGSRALRLVPADATVARFASRSVVRGDGVRETVLRVSIADRFGNPVSAVPAVAAERGRIAGVAAQGRGEFAVRYVAPAVQRPVEDTLVAKTGAARATLSPLVAPPAPDLRLEARGGLALDLAGRFGGPSAAIAAERSVDVAAALRAGLEPALRLEAAGLSGRGGALGSVLAGGSVRRLAGATVWSASAVAGAVLSSSEVAPAARLAVSAAVARAGLEPFVELSVLAARAGGPGSFAAAALSVGIRLGVEGLHDDHPDRR